MSLRDYLAKCEKPKSLIHISESLDPIYEIPNTINNYDKKDLFYLKTLRV